MTTANTFAPAALLDLNGLARAMSADNLLALLSALVGAEVLIAERGPDPDRLVEYRGRVEDVRPSHTAGVVLQLESGNLWLIIPGHESATEPVLTYFT